MLCEHLISYVFLILILSIRYYILQYLHVIVMGAHIRAALSTRDVFSHLRFPCVYNSPLVSHPAVALNDPLLFSSIIYPSINIFSGKHAVFPQSRVSAEMC